MADSPVEPSRGQEGPGILIAVDGPSGSGKSTVSKRVAADLGLAFLETGAMYRALTWDCLRAGVDLEDVDALLERADQLDFESVGTVETPKFLVRGVDVTQELRGTDVAAAVSQVAGHIPVRKWMAKAQRSAMLQARSGAGMIAEGRDITTVVCPDADVRILRRALRDIRDRGRTLESVITQYLTTVKPMHEQFVEPTRKFADIIVLEGGHNLVALDMIMQRIAGHIKEN